MVKGNITMTEEQLNRCRIIIHSSAATAAAGNAVPVPGTGVAADVTALIGMCIGLSTVFGAGIPEGAARGMAIASLKRTLLKQPTKVLTKTVTKYIPFLGPVVAASISFGLAEAAGWEMVAEFEATGARYLAVS